MTDTTEISNNTPHRKKPVGPPKYLPPGMEEEMVQWSDNKLMSHFHHEGDYPFEIKVFAGELLYLRNHDLAYLREQMNAIKGKLKREINMTRDTESFSKKLVKEEWQKAFGLITLSAMGLILFLFTEMQKFGTREWSRELLSISIVLPVIAIVYSLIMIPKKIKKTIEEEVAKYKTNLEKMELIRQRWLF